MIGLAESLPSNYDTVFASFPEQGLSEAFLAHAHNRGHKIVALKNDYPHLIACMCELISTIKALKPDVLCAHGYKSNFLGVIAARRCSLPIMSVSRGWTNESLRVKVYEHIDRIMLKNMTHIVCVSRAQQDLVRKTGVHNDRASVIHNAIHATNIHKPTPATRQLLVSMFPGKISYLVGAAGRLSPEKGFETFVDAAAKVRKLAPEVGFILYGAGPLRVDLASRVKSAGLADSLLMPGFSSRLGQLLPCLDLLVLPSLTEGLPNIVLESLNAKVPTVATPAGGTPELVIGGKTGVLSEPKDADGLARRIMAYLRDPKQRIIISAQGKDHIIANFDFKKQSEGYQTIFERLSSSAPGILTHASANSGKRLNSE